MNKHRTQQIMAKASNGEASKRFRDVTNVDAPPLKKKGNLAEFVDFYIQPSVVEVKEFLQSHETNIDDRDGMGKTALMNACCEGNKNLIKLLLEKGANPNLVYKRKGNTAFHEACEYEIYSPGDKSLTAKAYEKRLQKEDNITLGIVKLLRNKGASMQLNKDGLSPVDVAALTKKTKTVTYCVNSGWISPNDQIKALEILGMALGIYGDHENAYRALCQAMEKRMEQNIPRSEDHEQALRSIFGRAESRTMEELEKVKNDEEAMREEGFLIGERILPKKLKEKHVYNMLAELALDTLMYKDKVTQAFDMFSGCLQFEKKGLLNIGRVLYLVMQGVGMLADSFSNREKDQFIGHVCDILTAYPDVFREVDCARLNGEITEIADTLAKIIFDVTDDYFSLKFVDALFPPISAILTTIWGRIPKPSYPSKDYMNRSSSVCHRLIDVMAEQFSERPPPRKPEAENNRFKRVIAQLLQIEDAFDVNSAGRTMLNSLMSLLAFHSCERFPLVVDITRLLLRHGCARDKGKYGSTPKSIAEAELDELSDDERPPVEELYDLLDGRRELFSLEELCVRAVYRHRIHYRERLPQAMWHILQDSILKEPEASFH